MKNLISRLFFAIKALFAKKPTIEWVTIPAGTFTMGSPISEIGRSEGSETQHKVILSAFKMSKYQVTFDQYDLFCEATFRKKPDDNGWGRGNRPVIRVGWDDANNFAKWMGCRLPTEAEWEYACRAGTISPFNTGNNLTTDQANYNGKFPYNKTKGINREKTMPVGSFAPNAWGLYDMHGNVSEWCVDKCEYDYNKKVIVTDTYINGINNPLCNTGHFRMYRGGNWENGAYGCRSAQRCFGPTTNGIRLVSPM